MDTKVIMKNELKNHWSWIILTLSVKLDCKILPYSVVQTSWKSSHRFVPKTTCNSVYKELQLLHCDVIADTCVQVKKNRLWRPFSSCRGIQEYYCLILCDPYVACETLLLFTKANAKIRPTNHKNLRNSSPRRMSGDVFVFGRFGQKITVGKDFAKKSWISGWSTFVIFDICSFSGSKLALIFSSTVSQLNF